MNLSIKDIREGKTARPLNEECEERPRRLKVAYITPELLVRLMRSNVTIRIESHIPEDIDVVGAHWDAQRRAFGITLEHESFGEVLLGEVIPQLEEPCVFHTITEPPPSTEERTA